MSRHTIWVSLVALAVAATACSTGPGEADFEDTAEPTSIIVTTGIGDVTIRANSASGTEVRWDATSATPNATLDAGVLTLTDDCSADCRVHYTVLVGDEAEITIELDDGNVSVSNVDGQIDVSLATGNVNLNTISGGFAVAIDDEGDVLGARLEGSGGSFRTASGSVDVTFDTAVTDLTIESGKGDVTAQIPGGPYLVDARATGSTEVLVDTDAAATATITIATDDGDATVYKK